MLRKGISKGRNLPEKARSSPKMLHATQAHIDRAPEWLDVMHEL
jgi:hypothetical protein